MRSLIVAFVALLAVHTSALADGAMLGKLHIQQPWARATIGHVKNGAAYLTVANHADETDTLVSATSDVAKRTEIHTHLMEDGVMKMRELEGVEVAPGEPTVFAPGGLHIMLIGLHAPLIEGESFPLTLTFAKAGSVEVEVTIEKATAKQGSGDGKMHHHGHSTGS